MTMTTMERPTAVATSAGALAIHSGQTAWTANQEAVLRQAGIGDDVSAAELAAFLHLCQRTQLDPFSRQIYLIGRYDKRKQRTVYTPQTGIDGYRVIAQRVTGQTGGTYGYEDTLWCDKSGRWRDVWLADEPPAAAKVTVIRNGARFSAVARFSEYAETWPDGNLKSMWAKMPAGQIAKCCEALALRKAFPHDLAGVYTAEEMAQADNPQHAHTPEPQLQRQQPRQADQWQQLAPAAEPVQQTPSESEPNDDLSPQARGLLAAAEAAETAEAFAAVRANAERAGAPAPFLARLDIIAARKRRTVQEPAAEPPMVSGDPGRIVPGLTSEMVRAAVQNPSLMASQVDQLANMRAATVEPAPLPGAPADTGNRTDAIADLYAAGKATGMTQVETRQVLMQETGRTVGDATAAEMARVTADLRVIAGGAR